MSKKDTGAPRITATLTADVPIAERPSEPIRKFVYRVASHSRGIMNARVHDQTSLSTQSSSIALQVMRRYSLRKLELYDPCTIGELIAEAERQTASS